VRPSSKHKRVVMKQYASLVALLLLSFQLREQDDQLQFTIRKDESNQGDLINDIMRNH